MVRRSQLAGGSGFSVGAGARGGPGSGDAGALAKDRKSCAPLCLSALSIQPCVSSDADRNRSDRRGTPSSQAGLLAIPVMPLLDKLGRRFRADLFRLHCLRPDFRFRPT